ncbi:sensor histidine kinase [Salidesulfovibrio brasiliensis]|uniref:sensor histidine kinase n=1 Tax=Salidesulfovibrio brasiliensis TaxID=221711 RepID=UPI0006D1EAC5|nr:HAMP domain-containing sensor histidine kinase [Salidesulfovibrio brasiliensis]
MSSKPQGPASFFNRGTKFTRSLAFKIILPVTGVILLTCVALFALYSHRTAEQGRADLRERLELFANSKAAELAEPLWNFQFEHLKRLMRSYQDNQHLYRATLYDHQGRIIADVKPAMDLPYSEVIHTERRLRRAAGNEVLDLGRVAIEYHDGDMRTELLKRRRVDTIFTIVFMVVLGSTVWLSVHFIIGRPLKRIQNVLHENTTNGLRKPLVWNKRDELGEMVQAYNAMMRQVEQQTHDLVEMNTTLRSEVAQRRRVEEELNKAQQELERKVEQRTLELRLANKELIELDKQRSAFLASASHELRTPLSAILGFAILVKKHFKKHFMPLTEGHGLEDKSETLLANLRIIGKEGKRLSRLVDDLLDLNKIEAGHMEWRDTELNVPDEIARATKTMSSSLNRKPEVNLYVFTETGLPPINCDPDRFQQVLINLLSNAVKHTDKGEISLKTGLENGMISISVSDTGKGIPTEDLPFIFQKFYQSGSGDTFKPTGTGLGLAICKNIVEHYGGDISVQSRSGVGSTFTIELPVTRVEDEE